MLKKLLILFLTLVFISGLFLNACAESTTTTPPAPTSTTTPANQPKYGGTLKVILRANVTTIGTPSEGPGGAPHRGVEAAYDFLVRYDENFNIQPRLAESWDVTPDGKSITFHLKKGVKFHDGTPFNAAAVKANLDVYAPNNVRPPSLTKVSSIDVIDEYTVRLNLKAFDSTIFLDLGDGPGMMCSPAALARQTTPENMAKDHLVGTGPFKLVEFVRSQWAKYVKNPDYYEPGKPYLDAFEVYFIPDPVTSIMSFKKGDAMVIHGLTPTEANDLKNSGYIILPTQVKLMNVLLPDGLNADSPWSNKLVREAAEYAIDKEALARSIGEGYYDASWEFAPEGAAHYVSGMTFRKYDQAKAKQLLTQAGFPTGFKTKIYALQTYNKDILVGIQTYLKEVGIDAELDLGDPARQTDFQNNGWKNGLFIPGVPIISNLRSLSFRLAGGYHVSMGRPADWQTRVDATVAETDPAKSMEMFRGLVKTMVDEAMNIPLWGQPDLSAIDPKVHDLEWTQHGHPRFYEAANAWISEN